MRTKALLAIIAVIIIASIGIGSYLLLQSPEYNNITMNGVTFEVPKANVTVSNQSEHYSIYNDSGNGITIFVLDSEGIGMDEASQAVSFAGMRDAFQANSQLQEESNYSYNYSDSMKVYTYLTNYTHKNVFIVTKNKKDMQHILSSIKVDQSNTSLSNDTNNNTTTNSSKKTTSNSKASNSNKNSKSEYGDYINGKWVSMSEDEYAERYPALYHIESNRKGKYDKYHPELYEVDKKNSRK